MDGFANKPCKKNQNTTLQSRNQTNKRILATESIPPMAGLRSQGLSTNTEKNRDCRVARVSDPLLLLRN